MSIELNNHIENQKEVEFAQAVINTRKEPGLALCTMAEILKEELSDEIAVSTEVMTKLEEILDEK